MLGTKGSWGGKPPLLLAPFVLSRRLGLRRKNKDQKVNGVRVGVLHLCLTACYGMCQGDRVTVSVHTLYRLQDFQWHHCLEFHIAPSDSQLSCFLFRRMGTLPGVFLFVLMDFRS